MKSHNMIPSFDRAELAAARLNLRQRLTELTGGLGNFNAPVLAFVPDDLPSPDDPDATERDAVRAALARIEDGSYGDCVSCGAPVGKRRLHITPHAANCIACEAERLRAHWCADKPIGAIQPNPSRNARF